MRILLSTTLVLTLLVAVRAEEPHARARRQVDPSRQVDLPFAHLKLREDLRLTEGPRSLRDAFPYLAAAPVTVSSTNATALTPATLGAFLVQAPQEGGHVPAALRTGAEALEAVRLFVAGPLVTSPEAAARLVAVATEEAEAPYGPNLTDHRPPAWTPSARALPQDRSIHPVEAWEVSLVALEIDRKLDLVHVTATARADGTLVIKREPIVDGPYTTWQSEGEATAEERRADAARRQAVERLRKRFAKALAAKADLDTAWAIVRADPRYDAVRLWLGEPDRDLGSGIRIHAYDLADGGVALFGEVGDPLIYAYWTDPIDPPGKPNEIRRRLYVGPTRRGGR